MHSLRVVGVGVSALSLSLLAACFKTPSIDWSAKENFFVAEKSQETPDGARLEFHSLVDVPAPEMYHALADAENYARFVDGVSESSLVSADKNTKITQITETVIVRQARAQVKWTLHPEEMRIDFETLKSDQNYNEGSYQIFPSPDGKRCFVVSVFDVKQKGAPQNVPLGVLKAATRESFEKAARSVKQQASKPKC